MMNLRHSTIGTHHLDSLSCEVFWQTLIKALIRSGADPNALNKDKRTPLHFAAGRWRENPVVIEALLKAGAHPNSRDEDE